MEECEPLVHGMYPLNVGVVYVQGAAVDGRPLQSSPHRLLIVYRWVIRHLNPL